ncbi:MAG TPA: hypothetical protein VEG67_01880 [Myxococcota bacterium]|nr:hypothetical protein [Myxococcota bacterium]
MTGTRFCAGRRCAIEYPMLQFSERPSLKPLKIRLGREDRDVTLLGERT